MKIRPIYFVILALLGGAYLRFHQLGIVPPGLHYDPAANAIFAQQIAEGTFREVFITAYTGKEVLYFYTAGLLFYLIQSSIFILQYTAAIYGILSVAAIYFAARQLTYNHPDSRWIAAIAATLLAFSFMNIVWSRYGERVTTQPFIQALAIGFLFKGLNHKDTKSTKEKVDFFAFFNSSRFSFILAGIFTGLAAYTYISARFFPIPIALVLLIAVFINKNKKTLIANYFLFFAFALIVFAPLGQFFIQHPETFFVRFNQVVAKGDESALLWRGISGALGMIFISGEPYDRYNLPLKPIFDPIIGFFFIIGLIITIRKSINRQPSSISKIFLIIYTLTFLTPTALSIHEIFPSNIRSMGVMAILPIFPALGIVDASRWLLAASKKFSVTKLQQSNFFVIAFLILNSSLFAFAYNDYFNRWATMPSLYYANDTDLANASRWLNTQNTSDTSLYFSAIHYRHPTVAFLAHDYQNIRWYFGANALAIPEGKSLYIFPHSEPMIPEWIENWKPIYAPLGPDGTPDFRIYKFDSPPPLINFDAMNANFSNIVEITGMRTAAPNAIDLKLHVLNLPPRADYRLVADLVDERGFHWTQTYNDSYPSEQWQIGETILMRLKFQDQIGRPNSAYKVFLSLYSPSDQSNLSVIGKQGTAAYAILNSVSVSNLQTSISSLQTPLTTLDTLNIIKLDAPPANLRQGEPLPFAIYWQAPNAVSKISVQIKLNDREIESRTIKQLATGEVLVERYAPRIPRDLVSGVYQVTVNDFSIGTVTVKDVERQMTAPATVVRLNQKFSDQFELVGYDLKPDSITLHWRTLKEADADYTAFVHVLDSGNQIIAQNDSQPRNGAYPTSMWVKGEYVSDTIKLDTTAGATIEIGWYEQESGVRVGEALKIKP